MALLEVEDVHVHYGKIHALKGISLKVEPQQIVALPRSGSPDFRGEPGFEAVVSCQSHNADRGAAPDPPFRSQDLGQEIRKPT